MAFNSMLFKPRLTALTSLRFFAAMNIVLYHFVNPPLVDVLNPSYQLVKLAFTSVSFFVVLSGFILVYSYPQLDSIRKRGNFWLARFARLYPAFILALALSLIAQLMYGGAVSLSANLKTLARFVLEGALLQAWLPWAACGQALNCPAWSVSVQVFLYLAFPFAALQLRPLSTKALLIIIGIMWLASGVGPTLFQLAQPYLESLPRVNNDLRNVVLYNPLLHLPQFCIGVATGVLFSRQNEPLASERQYQGLVISVVIIFVLVGAGALLTPAAFQPWLRLLLNNGLLAPLFALAVYLVAQNRGGVSRLLSLPIFVVLGEASYAMYILQFPVATFFLKAIGQSNFLEWSYLLAYMALLISLAVLILRVWETPLRKYMLSWRT